VKLAVIVAALTLAPAAIASADDRNLFVYGDSFAIGTEPYLPGQLDGWQIETDADYNRHTRSVPAALRAEGDQLAPFVHLSVGTVDDPTHPGRFRRRVRKIMRIVGEGRCVVWANIARPRIRPNGQGYNGWRPLNEVLRDEARRRTNLVVLRWTALTRAHPEWFADSHDGTHVNQRGYRARARLVADGVRECQDRL
jgi:lysophospholipase L1-like esterase